MPLFRCCNPSCPGLPYKASEQRHPCGWNADMDRKEREHYLLTDLSTGEEIGVFLTLAEARRNIGRRPRYVIHSGRWDGEDFTHGKRVEFCDPYDSAQTEDLSAYARKRCSMCEGFPGQCPACAVPVLASEDYQLDASQAGEDW
jgi:hypothetical protein